MTELAGEAAHNDAEGKAEAVFSANDSDAVMKNQQPRRQKRSVAHRESKKQLALPPQRPVPATFDALEDLAHKHAEWQRFPILPDTSAVVLADPQKERALAHANTAGLATLDLPPALSPRQVTGLRLLERAQWTLTLLRAVGTPTLDAIRDARAEYGVAEDDEWVYLQWVFLEHQEQKVAYFRVILPRHMAPENALKEDVLSTAFAIPWNESYRGYRFDVFGRIVRPSDDTGKYPLPVRWGINIQQDRNQPGRPENGTSVLLNGRIEMAAYCARAYHPTSPIFAKIEWRPGWKHAQRGTVDLTEDRAGTHTPTAANRGLKLLDHFRNIPGLPVQTGRPDDSGDYDDASEPRFFDDLGKAAHAAVKAGEPISYASIARHGCGDRRTVKKYVERFKYDLTKIEAEAVRCTTRAFICHFHVQRMAEFKKNQV